LLPTRSRLPFETTHLRDHRIFPGLLVPRAPNDWVFVDTCFLSTSNCNGLCGRRSRPGHHDSRAQYNWVFIDCRALTTPGSNNLEELSPFCTLQEAVIPRLHDWKIVPGPDVNRFQRLYVFVNSLPISGSVLLSSNMHSDLLVDSNARLAPSSILLIEPVRASTLRERLQILRFYHVRALFWFVKHLFHVLYDICLNLSTLIQRVVRAVHASDYKMVSEILINGKRSRNDALRARRINILFMRTFMSRHDFCVYYIRMHCIRALLFPWLYCLTVRSTIFFVHANTWRHCLYHKIRWDILYRKYRLYHKLQVMYRNLHRTLKKVGISFKNMAHEYSNTGYTSMFRAQNIAIVHENDALDIISREPPTSFVYSALPPGAAHATQNLKRRSISKHRKNFGGGFIGYRVYHGEVLKCYILNHRTLSIPICDNDIYVLKKYGPLEEVYDDIEKFSDCIIAQVPIQILTEVMTINDLKDMGRLHRIEQTSQENKKVNKSRFKNYHCHSCPIYYSLFTLKDKAKCPPKTDPLPETKGVPTESYPPPPADDHLIKEIINGFCQDIHPNAFEEAGCGVCGQLNMLSNMKPLGETCANLNLLVSEGFTRCPRKTIKDPIEEIAGPTIDASCEFICTQCEDQLLNDKVPLNALAKGLWLGAIPPELSNLTFAEQMMIARIRHNRCLVRVSSGRAKMIANCIMFANPTAELYSVLPPSREELSEVLAFVFLGSARPSDEDLQRTPMLVRRN